VQERCGAGGGAAGAGVGAGKGAGHGSAIKKVRKNAHGSLPAPKGLDDLLRI